MEEGLYSWVHIERLVLSCRAGDSVGFFLWTMEMAALLADALGGYRVWFRKDAPELREVPPEAPPPHIPLEHIPLYHDARREHVEHNAAINNGRMATADIMGQMLARIVNEIKPDKVPYPQIKIDMPEHYKGDPDEIDNWL